MELKLKAMAKINLGLDVVRKREDGYHDLRMIMQSIYLYDQIILRESAQPGIQIRTNLGYLPVNEDNLVYKAASLLMEEFSVSQGLQIELKKYIPVAAGLAGGSSDAAAVLVGVNRMFRLGLSRTDLMHRGVRIGADVPYCVMRGTALAEGIGDVLTPLSPAPDCHVVLAKPAAHISTAYVYGNLRADQLQSHPDIDAQLRAIEQGDLRKMAELMGNVLQTVTIPACPVIGRIRDCMLEHGALNAQMSGSGPSVFGLFEDKEQAQAACTALEESGMAKSVFLTRFFHNRSR